MFENGGQKLVLDFGSRCVGGPRKPESIDLQWARDRELRGQSRVFELLQRAVLPADRQGRRIADLP